MSAGQLSSVTSDLPCRIQCFVVFLLYTCVFWSLGGAGAGEGQPGPPMPRSDSQK